MKHHTGEISFPRGIFDLNLDNTLQETALRERYEEIGIPRENLKINGRLDDLPTLKGFIIRPFISLIINSNKIEFNINHKEVEELVEIPIEYITQKNLFCEIPFPKDPKNWKMLSFKFKDPYKNRIFNIWGATAHMLQEFIKKLYDVKVITPEYKRPTLPECVEFLQKKKS